MRLSPLPRLHTPFIAAAVGLLLILAPAASAGKRVVQRSVSAGASRAAVEYWTAKRMRTATPLAVPQQDAATALASPAPRPKPTALPASRSLDLANTLPPRAPRGTATIGIGDRPPFTSGEVPLATQTTFPTSTNGKLFGKLQGLGGYSCSATVISSSSHSVIMTAGHCVFDEKAGFARKVVFVPAYHDGDRPFGAWSAASLSSTKQWQRATNFNYDYASIRLRKSGGDSIGDVVGEQGVAFDQAREQVFQAIGYPFDFKKTERMWNCVAPFAGADPRDRTSGQPDSAIGCDMSSGASGGGWFIRDLAGTQYLNSVTSFGYRKIRKTLFGPYLTHRVLKVINAANRG